MGVLAPCSVKFIVRNSILVTMKKPSLLDIYNKLLSYFGKQHWWPAQTSFEVIVGAILTQQTAWRNVEKAIENLKKKKLLNLEKLANAKIEDIENAIQSSGFYRQKAKRLKNISKHLFYNYSKLEKFFEKDAEEIRAELLGLSGIGEETADSILLYAGNKLKFVIDAYTIRICQRVGITKERNYSKLQKYFEHELPKNLNFYKEFHALFVELGKNYCKQKPVCEDCLLNKICKFYSNMKK